MNSGLAEVVKGKEAPCNREVANRAAAVLARQWDGPKPYLFF